MNERHVDAGLVVVGSGVAGLMAAAVAAEWRSVTLVTDRGLGTSNSAVAQGGLQFPADTLESIDGLRRDMLASGGESISMARLDHFVRSAHPAIAELLEFGLELDRTSGGSVVKLIAGGMSEPRLVTAGTRIGPALLKVLRNRISQRQVEVHTKTPVTGLRRVDHGGWIVESGDGEIHADSVIVATGGRAYEYAHSVGLETSNPANNNGRMHRVLRGLGLPERDVDRYQFHPYGLVDEFGRATGKCVPETIGRMGAYAADATGRRLAPSGADRAAITQAMWRCLDGERSVVRGDARACRLVLDGVDLEAFLRRYPHVARTLAPARLDSGDLCIRPIVHYQLGGFDVHATGATELPGLYLAGEVTGGLHGANRLMGNGITEAVVDGWSAALAACGRVDDVVHSH